MTWKAIWNGAVLAESEAVRRMEGNACFPPETTHRQYFRESDAHTTCFWKGVASYYNVVVNGQTNKGAAWYYPETSQAARAIEGYVGFWRGVKVVQEG